MPKADPSGRPDPAAAVIPTTSAHTGSSWVLPALWVVMLLALGLRVYRLDAQSLWNDEGTSVALAQRTLATISRNAASDIHPPLYYYLLHFWVLVSGTSEYGVRLLSASLGVLLVAATHRLTRDLATPAVALLAALIAALSPFQVYYSQEARMYVLVSLFSALSVVAFSRVLVGEPNISRARDWAAYVLFSVLALYSQYYSLAVLLAENVAWVAWLALRGTRHNRIPHTISSCVFVWMAAQATIILCYVPWLLMAKDSLLSWPAVSAALSLRSLISRVSQTFVWGVAVRSDRIPSVMAVCIAALTLPGLWMGQATSGRSGRSATMRTLVTALYMVIPIALMYALSLRRPMYKDKFLLLATPPFYALQACGIANLGRGAGRLMRPRAAQTALLTVLVLGALGPLAYGLRSLYIDSSFFRDDYRGIVAYINATAKSEDAILINAPSQIETVNYYYHGPLAEYALPQQRPIDIVATESSLRSILARHERIYAIYWATHESDPQGFIEGWLDQRCYKAMDRWFGNLRMVVYAVPQQATSAAFTPSGAMFGTGIRLRGHALLTKDVQAGDIVQLTLSWECAQPIGERLKVFVHLVDGQGNIVGQRDSEPVGGSQPTSSWQPGQVVVDNYGIGVPAGAPPGEHRLLMGLYRSEGGQRLPVWRDGVQIGAVLDLGVVRVQRTQPPASLVAMDMQWHSNVRWDTLRLEGYSLHRLGQEHLGELPLRPGDTLRLLLFWSKAASGPAPEAILLSLIDGAGKVAWEQQLPVGVEAFPPADWHAGEVVRQQQNVTLPGDLRPGRYRLETSAVAWADRQGRSLGRVTVIP